MDDRLGTPQMAASRAGVNRDSPDECWLCKIQVMPTPLQNRREQYPVIEAYKRDVDASLIRQNLQLTPHERLEKLISLQHFAAELRRAGQPERLPR